MINEKPFTRSYWVIPGKFLAGCYPGDKHPKQMETKLLGLVRAGVTRVINLMEADETDHSGQPFMDYATPLADLAVRAGKAIRCDRYPIRDFRIPRPSLMTEILNAIKEELAVGGVVYVHCWGGKGRTGTVVGCYLVESGMTDGPGALERIKMLTSHVREFFKRTPENDEQEDFVRNWRSATVTTTGGMTAKGRHRGCFLGVAIGDAVGTTLEFKSPGTFRPIDDMIGGGPFGLRPGNGPTTLPWRFVLPKARSNAGGLSRRTKWSAT